LKRAAKIFLKFIGFMLLLLLFLTLLIRIERVQKLITDGATAYLSSYLETEVSVGHIYTNFVNSITLGDLIIEDLHGDTLLFVGNVKVKIQLRALLRNHIKIRAVEIDNPKLYVHRLEHEEDFNYQFIVDKFASQDTVKSVAPKIILDLKTARISWLDLRYEDAKEREHYQSSFSNLSVADINYTPKTNKLEIDKVVLDDAHISITTLPRFNFPADSLLPKVQDKIEQIVKQDKDSSAIPFSMELNYLLLNNAAFTYNNNNREPHCDGIDFNHVTVSNAKVFAENIFFTGDSVTGQLRQVSAQEQSGFMLNRLKADFLLNSNIMEFKNLLIETPNSNIGDYYSMSYNSFADFKDYLNAVVMRGNFKKSKVSFKDINYFARVLGSIEHNTVMFEGQARGTVSNLKCRNIVIDAGNVTRFTGNVDLIGLPNINETFISANLDKVRTDINDVSSFYKGIIYPKELERLGLTRISGKFDGFISDFVANAQIVTQIGVVNSDINFKFKDKIENAAYSGSVAALDFDLGALLNNDLLGRTSFNAKVKGSGVTLRTLESEIQGNIQQVTFKNYPYSNITVDGKFTKSTFLGMATADDPNAKFNFSGAIDMSKEIPEFDFNSDVTHINFKNINLLKDNISLSTKLDLNFSGIRIDELVGLLDIKNTIITKDTKTYSINNIQLESIVFEEEGTKKITFDSDVLNAEVRGKINFNDIGTTMQFFFNDYFKKTALELDLSEKAKYSQDFNFYVDIKDNTKDLTELLAPQLLNIGQTHIEGNFNSERNMLKLNAQTQSIQYSKFLMQNINVKASGTPEMIFLDAALDSLFYADSLFTQQIHFTSKLKRDTVEYMFAIQDSFNPNRVRLGGFVQTDLKSISASFVNSDAYFNNKQWLIPNNNSVYYNGKILAIKNLGFERGLHKINVQTHLDADSNSNLVIELNDMLMDDILDAVPQLKTFKIKGHADGSVTVFNVLNSPMPMASVNIDSLSINEQMLGLLSVKSSYNAANEKVEVDATLTSDVNDVAIKGSYFIAQTDSSLDFTADINKLALGWVEPFIGKAVSKVKGLATGTLNLSGSETKPVVNGKLNLKEASANVSFLNMDLSLKDEVVLFKENLIDLDEITVFDNNGNTANARGKITHHYLSKFFFDINVRTDKFEFMNTTAAANSQFYGKAFGSAKVLIRGPINDLDFDIEATTQKNTKISIAVTDSKDISEYAFYRFVEKDAAGKKKDKVYAKKVSGVNFNINVTATPDAEVDLVLNSSQGDVITARGEGNLKVSYDKFGELSIIGNYTVTEGEYLFSMQNVISKKFQINRGSQIVWAGNPTDAKLAITAVYKLRASPYDLIEDMVKTSNDKMQQARIRVLVNLLLNIGGTITNPEISFDITIPDADPAIKSAVQSKLDFIRLEQNELNKQVVGLLVLNKFIPVYAPGSVSQLTNEASSFATGASNTVSEFVTNQLSIYLSDWLSKFVTDVQLDIGYRTYQNDLNGSDTGNDNPETENRKELQLALSKSFLNDRIFVDVGGNFDFGGSTGTTDGGNASGQNTQRGNNVAGDFEIQYAITPDGRYKVKAFRRGEYDIFSERNRNKTGVGIQYKKEFDNWKDLMQSGKEKKAEKKEKKAKQQ
jgi:hypothetical protein